MFRNKIYIYKIAFRGRDMQDHIFIHTAHNPWRPLVSGQNVSLKYDPSDISLVFLEKEIWGTPSAAAFMGFVFYGISGFLFYQEKTIILPAITHFLARVFTIYRDLS